MKKTIFALMLLWVFIDYSSYKSLTYSDSFFGVWDSKKYYTNQPHIAQLNSKLQMIIAYGYFAKPLSGRCSVKQSRLESELLTDADYFQCDRFQRYINRE